MGDHEEAAARDDLLLYAGAALYQLADELHQAGAETRVLLADITTSAGPIV